MDVQNQRTGNPAFAADCYHLTFASAAIGVGILAGVDYDIDGGIRPDGLASDLGVDEFLGIVKRFYLPVVMKRK